MGLDCTCGRAHFIHSADAGSRTIDCIEVTEALQVLCRV